MDQRYIKGIDLFNQGEFHECHEILEDFWKDREGDDYREFYQGIIQAAVAIYLVQEDRLVGAHKVYKRSMNNLNKFRLKDIKPGESSILMGININKLIDDLSCYFEGEEINIEDKPLPKIELSE